MTNQLHMLKQYSKDGNKQISCIYGWIGTGKFDSQGNEIFEGDIVKDPYGDEENLTVTLVNGDFELHLKDRYFYNLSSLDNGIIEVVGHVAEKGQSL